MVCYLGIGCYRVVGCWGVVFGFVDSLYVGGFGEEFVFCLYGVYNGVGGGYIYGNFGVVGVVFMWGGYFGL